MRQIKYILNYFGYFNSSDDGFHVTFEELMWIIFIIAFLTVALIPLGSHLGEMFNRANVKLDSYTF